MCKHWLDDQRQREPWEGHVHPKRGIRQGEKPHGSDQNLLLPLVIEWHTKTGQTSCHMLLEKGEWCWQPEMMSETFSVHEPPLCPDGEPVQSQFTHSFILQYPPS